jgi:hypothetical protein
MSSMPAIASRIMAAPALFTTQPGEQPALVEAALLDEIRGKLVGRDDFAWRDARCARRQVRVEKIGRRRGLDAARHLHRFVFRIQLERHRRHAVDQLVEKDLELAASAIHDVATRGGFGRRQFFEPRQLALELVRVRDDRVEADHLDGARRLVNVRARNA